MADDDGGGGGGGGGEGGGSSDSLPMEDLVEASQALAKALAADRARREAADRIQRESWEAALKEKDAQIDRLREEAADATKKLQADASRKMRWEAAHELLLCANRKLAELKDADMEDSRTCTETPNSKEIGGCTNLTVDHSASNFRKLKRDYETLNSNKDKEVSALLSKNDSLRTHLNLMQKYYAELLKNKKVAEAQARKAALKLQKRVDDLKVFAREKDDEIARLRKEAVRAKRKHAKDLSALLSEKNTLHNQLSIMRQDYSELLKNKKLEPEQATEATLKLQKSVDELKVLAQKRDDEIASLQAEAVEAKKEHDTDLSALLLEKDSVHKQLNVMQQDYTELLKSKEVLIQKKDNEISILRAEAVGAKKKLQRMHSLVKEKDDEIQRLKGGHVESVKKHYKGISETHKNSSSGDAAITVRDKTENSGIRQTVEEDYISEKKIVENDGQDESTRKRRRTSSMSNDDKRSVSDEDADEQVGSEEDGDMQSESHEDGDKQSGSDEDGGEHSGSGEDGHGDDNDEQSGSDEETTHNQVQRHLWNKGDVRTWFRNWRAPAPLRQRKLKISNGRRFMGITGHWGQFIKAVNDSLVDQPDRHKKFVQFLLNFEGWSARGVAREMKVLLNGQPKLIRQFNRFLPNNCQIEVDDDDDDEEEEEKEEEELVRSFSPPRAGPRPHEQLPSVSPSASAAAGLIKLKEEEQQPKREQV